jgi:uncharacterized protein YggE
MGTCIRVATAVFAMGLVSGHARADAPRRTVQVTARSEVKVPPDEVVTTFLIATEDKDLLKAKAANDQRTKAVLELSARHKISSHDIKITDLTVQPEFDETQGKKTFTSYSFNRSCEVTLHDFTKLEPFLADLLKTGVDYVNQMKFLLRDQSKALGQARELAVRYAKEKATNLARLNDLKLGKALTIYEHEHENEFAGGLGGMAATKRIQRGGTRVAALVPGEIRSTSPHDLAKVALTRHASFSTTSGRGVEDPAQHQVTGQRDTLLAPGQITIRARVTITFELIP